MVEDSLEDFKREWQNVAVSVQEEWKTSQRTKSRPRLVNYDADIISPGSSAKVALEKNHGKITVHAIPERRQRELCAILVNVCNNQVNEINQVLIHETKSGIKYLEFKVKQDIQSILKGKRNIFLLRDDDQTGRKDLQVFLDRSQHHS